MDRTLAEIIDAQGERVRPAVRASRVVSETPLRAVLDAPVETIERLRVTPGLGEATIAQLRQVLVEELEALAPRAMQEAQWACLNPEGSLPPDAAPMTATLVRFMSAWEVPDATTAVAGTFLGNRAVAATKIVKEALATQSPFVYAPESLPEILKTRAVLRAEQRASDQHELYAARLEAARNGIAQVPAGSLILIDRPVLEQLVACQGAYAALTTAAARAQLELLNRFLRHIPEIEVIVTDFSPAGLSPGFTTERGPLIHPCLGGYLQLRTREMLRHFLRMARSAAADGQPLAAWLADLSATSASAGRRPVARHFTEVGADAP